MEYILPNKKNSKTIFEIAIEQMQDSKYDLQGFTESKVEEGLTALIATGLMASNKNIHAYVEVPTYEDKGMVDQDNLTSRNSEVGRGERRSRDLFVLNRESKNWNDPEFYVEFKFKQNYDLEWFNQDSKKQNPSIDSVSNYVENLADLEKLYSFKDKHQTTRCLQGFYVCFNPDSPVYDNKGRSPNSNIAGFIENYIEPKLRTLTHETFVKKIEKSTDKNVSKRRRLLEDENLKSCKITKYDEIPIANEPNFWLTLVLLEIEGS